MTIALFLRHCAILVVISIVFTILAVLKIALAVISTVAVVVFVAIVVVVAAAVVFVVDEIDILLNIVVGGVGEGGDSPEGLCVYEKGERKFDVLASHQRRAEYCNNMID